MLEKNIINVTKCTIKNNFKELYDIFIIPEENSMNFYIQKRGYGIISYGVGLTTDDFSKLDTVEGFIHENISEWIENCQHDIEILEK